MPDQYDTPFQPKSLLELGTGVGSREATLSLALSGGPHPSFLDSTPYPGLVAITDFNLYRPPCQDVKKVTPRPFSHTHPDLWTVTNTWVPSLQAANESWPRTGIKGSLRLPEGPRLCRPGQLPVYTAVASGCSPHTPSAPGVSSQRTQEGWGPAEVAVPPPS